MALYSPGSHVGNLIRPTDKSKTVDWEPLGTPVFPNDARALAAMLLRAAGVAEVG